MQLARHLQLRDDFPKSSQLVYDSMKLETGSICFRVLAGFLCVILVCSNRLSFRKIHVTTIALCPAKTFVEDTHWYPFVFQLPW